MRRCILALMVLLMMMPFTALADEHVPYEVFTFSTSLPEQLKEPLYALIPDETKVISGAAVKHNGHHYGDHPSDLDSYTAMVLVSTDSGPRLYAAAWVEHLPWQVNDYTRFLRQTKNAYISVYKADAHRNPVFSVDYSVQGGIKSDLFCFFSNMLWCIDGHIDKSRSIAIDNEMNALTITDSQGREKFWCDIPFYLDYMKDINAFPTSRADCQALSRTTIYSLPAAGDIVYSAGANLRREPTGSSESLGIYADNVPMIFTGNEKQGSAWPWYEVKIGDTIGWMSSNYVHRHPDYLFAPISLGRTKECIPLYTGTSDKAPASELAPGTTFHILTEYDGMYHICIPQEELTWAADLDGTYGYISKVDVVTGYSPSSLAAQENAR